MAEVAGLASSIIAILKLTQVVVKYGRPAIKADKEAKALLEEIIATTGYLTNLQGDITELDPRTQDLLRKEDGPLKILQKALEPLHARLSETVDATGLRNFGKMLKWPYTNHETQELVKVVERQKQLLSLALQDDHVLLSRSIKENAIETLQVVKEINDNVKEVTQKVNNLTATIDGNYWFSRIQ
jgi:hypothetical protein